MKKTTHILCLAILLCLLSVTAQARTHKPRLPLKRRTVKGVGKIVCTSECGVEVARKLNLRTKRYKYDFYHGTSSPNDKAMLRLYRGTKLVYKGSFPKVLVNFELKADLASSLLKEQLDSMLQAATTAKGKNWSITLCLKRPMEITVNQPSARVEFIMRQEAPKELIESLEFRLYWLSF